MNPKEKLFECKSRVACIGLIPSPITNINSGKIILKSNYKGQQEKKEKEINIRKKKHGIQFAFISTEGTPKAKKATQGS